MKKISSLFTFCLINAVTGVILTAIGLQDPFKFNAESFEEGTVSLTYHFINAGIILILTSLVLLIIVVNKLSEDKTKKHWPK